MKLSDAELTEAWINTHPELETRRELVEWLMRVENRKYRRDLFHRMQDYNDLASSVVGLQRGDFFLGLVRDRHEQRFKEIPLWVQLRLRLPHVCAWCFNTLRNCYKNNLIRLRPERGGIKFMSYDVRSRWNA